MCFFVCFLGGRLQSKLSLPESVTICWISNILSLSFLLSDMSFQEAFITITTKQRSESACPVTKKAQSYLCVSFVRFKENLFFVSVTQKASPITPWLLFRFVLNHTHSRTHARTHALTHARTHTHTHTQTHTHTHTHTVEKKKKENKDLTRCRPRKFLAMAVALLRMFCEKYTTVFIITFSNKSSGGGDSSVVRAPDS